jgi:hypothetical protein
VQGEAHHIGEGNPVLRHAHSDVESSLDGRLVPARKAPARVCCLKLSHSIIAHLTRGTATRHKRMSEKNQAHSVRKLASGGRVRPGRCSPCCLTRWATWTGWKCQTWLFAEARQSMETFGERLLDIKMSQQHGSFGISLD